MVIHGQARSSLPFAHGKSNATRPELELQTEHPEGVESIAFSPDGLLFATGGSSRGLRSFRAEAEIKVWDARTMRVLCTLLDHYVSVTALSFSANSQRLAAFSNHIAVYDIPSHTLLCTLSTNQARQPIALDASGTLMAACASDGQPQIWALPSKKGEQIHLVRRLLPDDRKISVEALAIAPGAYTHQHQLMTLSNDHLLRVWTADKGKLQAITRLPLTSFKPDDPLPTITFSPDGGTFAVLVPRHGLWLYRYAGVQGKLIPIRTLAPERFRSRAFATCWITAIADGGNRMATFDGRNIAFWKVTPATEADEWPLYHCEISENPLRLAVAFNPQLSLLLYGVIDQEPQIHVYDTQQGIEFQVLPSIVRPASMVKTLAYDANRHLLITRGDDLRFWDIRTGRLLNTVFLPERGAMLAVSSQFDQIFFGQDDGSIGRYHLGQQAFLKPFTVHRADTSSPKMLALPHHSVTSLSLDRSGRWLVVAYSSAQILDPFSVRNPPVLALFDVSTGEVHWSVSLATKETEPVETGQVQAIISPEADTIAVCGLGSQVRIYDTRDGTLRYSFPPRNNLVSTVGFSQDGRLLASADADGVICVHNAQTQTLESRWVGPKDYIPSLTFTSNRQVVTAGLGRVVRVWRIGQKQPEYEMQGHSAYIVSLLLVPATDRIGETVQRVITASDDLTFRLWNPRTGQEICQFIALEGQRFAVLSSAYYMAANSILSSLAIRLQLHALPADQFDIYLNRPDKVLEALGCQDTVLLHAYHEAYYKRLKRSAVTAKSLGKHSISSIGHRSNCCLDIPGVRNNRTRKLLCFCCSC